MEPLLLVFRSTEIVLEAPFATTTSGLPSPSMSPMAKADAPTPVANATCVANEPDVIEPLLLVFRSTETAPFVTTKSGLLSPSISPMATLYGYVPTANVTCVANEPDVREPLLPVLRNTETVLVPEFPTAISGLPSPSISPMAMPYGCGPVANVTGAANEPEVMEPLLQVLRSTDTVLEN
jgi:hypothetical protein